MKEAARLAIVVGAIFVFFGPYAQDQFLSIGGLVLIALGVSRSF